MIQHKQRVRNAEASLASGSTLSCHLSRGPRLHLPCGIPTEPSEAGHRATPLSKNTTAWRAARHSRSLRTRLPGIKPNESKLARSHDHTSRPGK